MPRRVLLVLVALLTGALAPASASPGPTGTRLVTLDAGPEPLASPFPLTHVGARWHGRETAGVQVRTGTPGHLGPWRALPVAHDLEEAHLEDQEAGLHLSGLLRADGATLVQARASVPGEARRLEIVAIDASAATTSQPPGRVAVAGGGTRHPEVVSRAAWGADEGMRTGTPEFAAPSKLVVHHTVTPNDDPDPASTVRAIYAFHTRSRGWKDIGYNFVVDAGGRIYEGRYARAYGPGETPDGEDGAGRGVIGAHARGFNTGSVGVALLGDFSGGAQPTPAAVDALVALLSAKADHHGIDPHGAGHYRSADGATVAFPNIAGHRDVGRTACPGDRLYERLPEIRDRVAAGGAGPAPPAAPTPPPPVPAPPPVPDIPGFWTARADGGVSAFGDAPPPGDLGGRQLARPIVSFSARGGGYWLLGADGGVFALGGAPFLGTAAGTFAGSAVDLEPTPSGEGYWVVSAAGEVAAFGDARALGATAPLPVTVAGMAPTPSGLGYWLAAADGRVFSFGDALVHRQAQAPVPAPVTPAAPIVSITARPDGAGYWLVGADGGVFAYGAPFHGSLAGRLPPGVSAVRLRADGPGYYVTTSDGAVYAFGGADPRRERPGAQEGAVTVGMALYTGH